MERRTFIRSGLGIVGLAVYGNLAPCGPARAQRPLVRFSRAPLKIESGSNVYEFTVELARSEAQQIQGLMFRRRMTKDAGMLFVYGTPRRISMWMRNTYLPLDMAFIAADGKIARIVERTIPLSSETISSGADVVAVLELNAGIVAKLGIREGDRVRAAILGNQEP